MTKNKDSLATINVLVKKEGTHDSVDAIYAFPDTEEGKRQADACFLAICNRLCKSFKAFPKEEQEVLLKVNGCYWGDGLDDAFFVGIHHSTLWEG